MLHQFFKLGVLLSSLVLWAALAAAQDTNGGPQKPLAPMQPVSVGGPDAPPKPAATGSTMEEGDYVVPDSLPLVGALNLTLGSTLSGHNLLLPSFGFSTQVQTNPYNSSQGTSVGAVSSTYLTGRLALSRTSVGKQLLFDYLAGGTFTNDPILRNSGIQSLSFSDLNQWGRWSVMIGDQLNYTSQSPFGFGGLGGLNNLGVGLGNGAGPSSSFRPGFLPNQSILINGQPQLSNAVIGETDYALSHRSSLTFAGSYGILDFINGGFQNGRGVNFQVGYNYLLDRLNSIAVFYRFNYNIFSNKSQRINDHSVQMAYARRITGTLSFQVGAGPDIRRFEAPLSGPSSAVSWMASTALNYQHRNSGVGLNYDYFLTGGSGTFAGAQTNLLTGSLNHRFSKNWDGAVSTGYSRNQALQQTTLNANTGSLQGWFVTGRANRNFVRYGSLFIAYSLSGQSGLTAVCSQPACRLSSLNNSISIGYNWGLRPVNLE